MGTVPLVLVGIPTMADLDWTAVGTASWIAMVLSGIFAIGLAYFFWNYGVAQLGSARTSIYSNLSLPVALATGWIWLRETLTPMQLVGTLLALGGVILARRFTRPRYPPASAVGGRESLSRGEGGASGPRAGSVGRGRPVTR